MIDNYEIISGIDIPKQTHSQCFYNEKEQIRLGVYSLQTPDEFIEAHHLQKLVENSKEPLWSQEYLRDTDIRLPEESLHLFLRQGEKEGHSWQCIVDTHSGNMWFEVRWKE